MFYCSEQNCYLSYFTTEDCDQLIQFAKETLIKFKEWFSSNLNIVIKGVKKYLIKNSFHISLPILPFMIPGIVTAGVFLDITLTYENGSWKLAICIKSRCNINIVSLIDCNVEAGVGISINLSHVFQIIRQFFTSTPQESVPRTGSAWDVYVQVSANVSVCGEIVVSISTTTSLKNSIKKAWKYFEESICVNNLSHTFGVVHYY